MLMPPDSCEGGGSGLEALIVVGLAGIQDDLDSGEGCCKEAAGTGRKERPVMGFGLPKATSAAWGATDVSKEDSGTSCNSPIMVMGSGLGAKPSCLIAAGWGWVEEWTIGGSAPE